MSLNYHDLFNLTFIAVVPALTLLALLYLTRSKS
jgi:hypothetical protein